MNSAHRPAVRRGEVAALAHGQLFSGDFHRAAQAGGHGRVARQDVERVPVRDVPREAGGQVRAWPAVHAFEPLGDTPQGRRERRSKEPWAYSPDSGYPMAMSQSSAVRKRYSPSRKAVPCDMACMNGAECSGTRACSRTEARSGMASSRFCGNGPLPDTRFPADLSRTGRRFGVWDAGRSAGGEAALVTGPGAWSGGHRSLSGMPQYVWGEVEEEIPVMP